MKGYKKVLTGILAATLIMGSSLTAFAEESNGTAATTSTTVTIVRDDSYNDQNKKEAQKFTYYKILSADISSAGTTNADTGVQSGVQAAYFTDESTSQKLASVFEFQKGTDGNYYVTGLKAGVTDSNIASSLKSIVTTNGFTGTTIEVPTDATGKNTVINVPSDGYYLVVSELGDNRILETWGKKNITVNEKNDYPSIDKTQMDGTTTTQYQDDDIKVKVGDTVYYSVVVYVPEAASENIIVKDKMSVGLTPATVDTIVASVADSYTKTNGKITFSGTPLTSDWSKRAGTATDLMEGTTDQADYVMEIEPTANTLGKYVQFTFTAIVNEDALIDTGKENDVDLLYGNYFQHDTVKHEIARTGLVKYDADTADLDASTNALTAKTGKTINYLEGAEFDLYDGNTKIDLVAIKDNNGVILYYRPAVSGETGESIVSVGKETPVIIRGLDADKTYVLVETKAPTGFNLPAAGTTFGLTLEVDDKTDAGAVTVAEKTAIKVPNVRGVVLPSTGGVGTTIFYIIGGLLIVAAVVFFVVRRKADAE